MNEQPHPFDRSGLAAVSDFETPEWRTVFAFLESEQAEFLAKESAFRGRGYKWPRDPLHTWSRGWEYSYVYHHLERLRVKLLHVPSPTVVDLGSGVTFFPFSIARLNYRVICADIDPVCALDIPCAARVIPHAPGVIQFRCIEDDKLPFQDGEVDAVFCVSVLEHVPSPEKTVREIARILKPGGQLVLTIDLDLRGDAAIGVNSHHELVREIGKYFDYEWPDATIHPANMLDNTKGPFKTPDVTGFRRLWFLLKQRIKERLGKTPYLLPPYYLAVQGFVLVRKT